MAGTLRWSPDKWKPLTLRQLVIHYDAYLIDRWDHTATVAVLLHNLQATVVNLVAKSAAKPKTFYDLHPYRKNPKPGLSITPENFNVLRDIGNALVRRR